MATATAPSTVDWSHLWALDNFEWERNVTPFTSKEFLFGTIAVYLVTLFSLKYYMSDKPALSLKNASLVHNAFLTLISLAMFLGAASSMLSVAWKRGLWDGVVCEKNNMKGAMYYWAYMFYLSKFYELLDSYLLVLKKKPLIFLHVYHHAIVITVCWVGFEGPWAMALFQSLLWNTLVHVFMYSHYMLAQLGFNTWWKRYLTQGQICQFVFGIFITTVFCFAYVKDLSFVEKEGTYSLTFTRGCLGDPLAIIYMQSVNNSFLLLFIKWYYDNYKRGARRAPAAKETKLVKGD